jgi:hypothetical protein
MREGPADIGCAGASLSPSLWSDGGLTSPGPAYEIKFLLDDSGAVRLERHLLAVLMPDPHSDPALGGMYEVTSLACDTPSLAVFFRDKAMRSRKYRARRYGASGVVFLERKRSRRGRVRKRRVRAWAADLEAVASGRAADLSHAWFVEELAAQDLAPVCCVRYRRRALFGKGADGPVRVTFDRDVRGSVARGWAVEPGGEERPLLPGVVVCEFKFRGAMPALLKERVAAMKLEPTGLSKYRWCVRAFATELGVDLPRGPVEGVTRA